MLPAAASAPQVLSIMKGTPSTSENPPENSLRLRGFDPAKWTLEESHVCQEPQVIVVRLLKRSRLRFAKTARLDSSHQVVPDFLSLKMVAGWGN